MHDQLKCCKTCLIAKLGKAIDYHYFQTDSQMVFAEKSLIKQGFAVEKSH